MHVRYDVFLSDDRVFSRDYNIKAEISISNVFMYLNVYSIHAVPGFR